MGIRKHELHATERVRRPRVLAQRVRNVAAAEATPVDGCRIDFPTAGVQHLQAPAGDRPGIAFCRRQDVVADDPGWHRPGRIEDEVVDVGAVLGRLPVGLADLRPGRPDELSIPRVVDLLRGDVHEHELVRQVIEQHPAAIQVHAQLPDAPFHRDVQLRERARSDHPIRRKTHPPLEALHACLERAVVNAGTGCSRPTRPRPQPDLRWRPAASAAAARGNPCHRAAAPVRLERLASRRAARSSCSARVRVSGCRRLAGSAGSPGASSRGRESPALFRSPRSGRSPERAARGSSRHRS